MYINEPALFFNRFCVSSLQNTRDACGSVDIFSKQSLTPSLRNLKSKDNVLFVKIAKFSKMVRLPAVGELAVFVDFPVGSVRKLKDIDISIYKGKYKSINIFVFCFCFCFFQYKPYE